MDNDNIENVDSEIDEPVVDSADGEEESDPEVIKAQNAELAEKNKQLFARLKKAEGFDFKDGKWVKPAAKPVEVQAPAPSSAPSNLSSKDLIALAKAEIADEDLDEVLDYAAYKKIPVHEALKSEVIKSTLGLRAEQRATAVATNASGGRRSSGRVTDDQLLSLASQGKLPENDEDISRLMALRIKRKS